MEFLKCLFVPQGICTCCSLCPGCSSRSWFSSRLPLEGPSLTIFTKAYFLFILTSSTPWFPFQHMSQYVIGHWVVYCVGVCLPHWSVSSERTSCFLLSPHLPARACTEQMLSALLSNEWMLTESLLCARHWFRVGLNGMRSESGIEAVNREPRSSYLVGQHSSWVSFYLIWMQINIVASWDFCDNGHSNRPLTASPYQWEGRNKLSAPAEDIGDIGG